LKEISEDKLKEKALLQEIKTYFGLQALLIT
jgi:hypothetical protein